MKPILNPTQLHLLKVFSFAKSEKALKEIEMVLTDYFAKRTEKAMDKLWDEGLWDEKKNEEILKQHLRTSYHVRYRS